MDEAAARRVGLLQAFETTAPAHPMWSAQDAAWASRVAADAPSAEANRATDHAAYLSRRAEAAMQRLLPREPGLARWLQRSRWRGAWVVAAAAVGTLAGLVADALGNGLSAGARPSLNLLAPPAWGVVAWNLAVYALLLWHGVSALRRRDAPPSNRAGRWLAAWLHEAPPRLVTAAGTGSAAVASGSGVPGRFASVWGRLAAPLWAARSGVLLHTAGAALAVGLIAGMYVRGLVFDYRAGWESTFLQAGAVSALLSWWLAPASALTGIALPDASALALLRVGDGRPAVASAAPWIHLYAATLALFVVLPRTALALHSGWRARQRARRFVLPLDDPYFQRLLAARHGGASRIQVLPHAKSPGAAAALGLRTILARVWGDSVELSLEPVVPHGGEEAPLPQLNDSAPFAARLVLFDLTATPEGEHQGRLLQQLSRAGSASPTLALVDESAFVRRFAADAQRLAERRAAWRSFFAGHGTAPVFVNLEMPDAAQTETALRGALQTPLRGELD